MKQGKWINLAHNIIMLPILFCMLPDDLCHSIHRVGEIPVDYGRISMPLVFVRSRRSSTGLWLLSEYALELQTA